MANGETALYFRGTNEWNTLKGSGLQALLVMGISSGDHIMQLQQKGKIIFHVKISSKQGPKSRFSEAKGNVRKNRFV